MQGPAGDADPAVAAEALRAAPARLAAHERPFAAHPAIGPLSRDEWLRL